MSYNAVLRKENAQVFGRVSLSNLEMLPKTWEIMYGEKFIYKSTDLETLLCDHTFPLSIYTTPVTRQITVKPAVNDKPKFEYKFSVSKDVNVKELKQMICQKMEMKGKVIGLENQKLYFSDYAKYDNSDSRGTIFNNELTEDSKTIQEFIFKREGTLYLYIESLEQKKVRRKCYDTGLIERPSAGGIGGDGGPRRTPGPRCSTGVTAVDLKAQHVEEKGIPVKNNWEGYTFGLNIYGTCPTESCASHEIPLKQTSHRDGYGFLRIDMNKRTFDCPACWGGRFPPANFVVCNARALFRFKKTGSHLEVETSLLQSFGGIDEYARFNDNGEGVEYDWIEVKTVKKDESVHICSRCDMPIRLRVEAALYDCGHPVHRSCMDDECGICNARSLSEREVNALGNNATTKARPGPGPSGTSAKRKRK